VIPYHTAQLVITPAMCVGHCALAVAHGRSTQCRWELQGRPHLIIVPDSSHQKNFSLPVNSVIRVTIAGIENHALGSQSIQSDLNGEGLNSV
jgi:hypothetical protein